LVKLNLSPLHGTALYKSTFTYSSGGNNFDDFPDNKLTNFRVYIYCLIPDFNHPLPKFM